MLSGKRATQSARPAPRRVATPTPARAILSERVGAGATPSWGPWLVSGTLRTPEKPPLSVHLNGAHATSSASPRATHPSHLPAASTVRGRPPRGLSPAYPAVSAARLTNRTDAVDGLPAGRGPTTGRAGKAGPSSFLSLAPPIGGASHTHTQTCGL